MQLLDKSFEVSAKGAAVKSSVQKVNLVANLVRGMPVGSALLQLKFCRKKVAVDLRSILHSAVSNAENNFGLDIDRLFVSKIMVGKAFTLKRFRAGARGRARKIQKPFTQIRVYVTERGKI